MPLKWTAPTPDNPRCFNMFVCNSFGKLQISSAITSQQVSALRDQKIRSIRAGQRVTCAGGHPMTEFELNNAANNLQNAHMHSEELLLTHIQTPREGERQRKAMFEKLLEISDLQFEHEMLPLRHPLDLFWFVPAPEPDVAPLIPLERLDLVNANHPEDLELDVVFDI